MKDVKIDLSKLFTGLPLKEGKEYTFKAMFDGCKKPQIALDIPIASGTNYNAIFKNIFIGTPNQKEIDNVDSKMDNIEKWKNIIGGNK